MTIFEKFETKEASLTAIMNIVTSLKWDYENLVNELLETGDRLNDDISEDDRFIYQKRYNIIDSKIAVYKKVFDVLEKY